MTIQTSRRNLLKGVAATGTALFIGYNTNGILSHTIANAAEKSDLTPLNPFVKIATDGTVTIILKHFEMGQGTTTGLTTLVAEELDADWDKVAIEFAPADHEKYKNLAFGAQGTGGSTAIANSYIQYRTAGAAVRALLVQAAAAKWGLKPKDISVEKGMVRAGDKSAHFGELIADAAKLPLPEKPTLKTADQFNLIGKTELSRKDNIDKTDGTALFAMDVKVPNMVYAVILRSPRFGGTLLSFETEKASKISGFLNAKAMPTKDGVAIYATSTWAAISARKAIEAKWDNSKAENRSTKEIGKTHLETLKKAPALQARKDNDFEKTNTAIASASKKVEAEFLLPYLAHAPMEPLNCVIEPHDNGKVTVHDGCQFPGLVHPAIAKILGLQPDQVKIKTYYAGGSFGRRATAKSDYATEAALAFKLLGGKKAVKLVWTREDDLAGGYFRPMAAHSVKIGLSDKGEISGWNHHVVSQSIVKGTPFEKALVKDGVDHTSIEGIADTEYEIPALSVGLTDWVSPIPVLWWRSVGHSHTAYVKEVSMDLAAKAAEKDPVQFRLNYLKSENKDQKRLAGVIKLAAEKAEWSKPLPKGWARGIAAHKSFGSYVAQVIEISSKDGDIKIERVVCAVDCGVAVNPDVIKAQMEGGIGFGLGAIMRNQITLNDGLVEQENFPDYEPLRINDIGKIEVHITPSVEAPTGVGEPGVPPAGPALANAIMALKGKPLLKLPLNENGVDFA